MTTEQKSPLLMLATGALLEIRDRAPTLDHARQWAADAIDAIKSPEVAAALKAVEAGDKPGGDSQ